MSQPLRLDIAGSVWHVRSLVNSSRSLFRDRDDRTWFLELLGEAAERSKWIVSSYVLMPDRYRLTVELTADNTLSKGMQWLNGCYGQKFNWRHDRVGYLFRSPFEAIMLEKDLYLRRVMRDVLLAPVRAGLCRTARKYPWSSHAADPRHRPAWLVDVDSTEDFARFVDAGMDDDPWQDLKHGVFLGSDSWLAAMRDAARKRQRGSGVPQTQLRVGLPDMNRILDAVGDTLCLDREDLGRPRGVRGRMVAAWLGYFEGELPKSEIAAALGLRTSCAALDLIRRCDRERETNPLVAHAIEMCLDTIRRVKKLKL